MFQMRNLILHPMMTFFIATIFHDLKMVKVVLKATCVTET